MSQITFKTIKTKDFTMDCAIIGSGKKPYVMLPGASLKKVTPSANSVAEAHKAFSDEYTIYLFDRKDNIENGYTVKNMAEDTVAAIKSLGLTDIYLFGASLGGMVSLCIAAEHTELVKKMIIASSASRINETAAKNIAQWKALAEAEDKRGFNQFTYRNLFSDEFYRKYEKIISSMDSDGTSEEFRNFVYQINACSGFDIYNELTKITCPVLVIGDKTDKILTGEASEEIAEKLGCEIYMYDKYGHAVYDEAPDYKERIKEFFDR